MGKSKVLNLKDLLLIAVLGVAFGALNAFYAAVDMAMIGMLGPLGSSITIGVFFIAPLLAGFIIQKPGAAILTGALLGLGETLAGNPWGIITLIYGLIEGSGAELGYALFRYRRYNIVSILVAAACIAPIHYIYEFFQYGFTEFSVGYNIATFVVRVLSALVGGLLAYAIGKALARTGVLSGFALGKAQAEAAVAKSS